MPCDHCEEMAEEVAYLRSEMGLQSGLAEIEALRRAFRITPQCARILLTLYCAKGRVVSPLQILDALPPRYDTEEDRSTQTIVVQLAKVRKAMGADMIYTARGQGYQLSHAGLELAGLALGVERPVSGPELADLSQRPADELRVLAAHVAGILAHRDGDGGKQTATVYRRIADRLTGQPRRAA